MPDEYEITLEDDGELHYYYGVFFAPSTETETTTRWWCRDVDDNYFLYIDGAEFPQTKWYRPEFVCRLIWRYRVWNMRGARG